MQDFDKGEKFDIRKLPRLEVSKPMDAMMRIAAGIFLLLIPYGTLIRLVRDNGLQPGSAAIIGLVYAAFLTAVYYGCKRYYLLDRTRNALFKVTRVFGMVSESYLCSLGDIACVTIDSRERMTKNGGSTGQFWYESCFVLKNNKIVRLHRTFEDSYDEIQDAEQYAEYLGVNFFGPKPGLEMKVCKTPDGKTIVEFVR